MQNPADIDDEEDAGPAISIVDEDPPDDSGGPVSELIEDPAPVQMPPPNVVEPPPLINLIEPKSDEQLSVDAFVEKVMKERNTPVVVHEPPPMSERQLSAREVEMEAGRKRVAHFAEQQANRPVAPPEKSDGTTTPVFVPKEYAHERGNPSKSVG